MSFRGVHHLGFAVNDLEEAVSTYGRLFGVTLEHRDRLEQQGVEAAAVLVGDGRIELLAPTGDDTPWDASWRGAGRTGMHHVAYEVDDVRATLDRLERSGSS